MEEISEVIATIPHQLHLAPAQARKLIKGLPVQIPYANMGAEKGKHVLHLAEENAKKLLGAYKKGKGVRIQLKPKEIENTMIHGSGFNLGRVLKKAAHTVGSFAKEHVIPHAKKAIKELIPHVKEYAKDVILPKAKAYARDVLVPAAKQMLEDTMEGGELITTMPIKKPRGRPRKVLEVLKEEEVKGSGTREIVHQIGKYVNPLSFVGMGAKKGSPEMKAKMAALRARKGGKVKLDLLNPLGWGYDLGHDIIAPKLMGHGLATNLVGSIAAPIAGKFIADKIMKRGRGRPKKGTGATWGASKSPAYATAMKTLQGLEVSNVVDNRPVSDFKVNPKVKPSSTEMTLSPYQTPTAPAMNPFVPTTYVQEGGVGAGYGSMKGKGLYAGGLF